MQRKLLIECAALLAIGALGLAGGLGAYLRSDARTQSSLLQPGVYVVVIAAALIVTALAYGALGLRRLRIAAKAAPAGDAGTGGGGEVWLVYASIVLYGVLIPVLGYLPATMLFLAAEFRILGVRSWPRNVALTLATTAVFYVLFVHYGEMVFPRGAFLD